MELLRATDHVFVSRVTAIKKLALWKKWDGNFFKNYLVRYSTVQRPEAKPQEPEMHENYAGCNTLAQTLYENRRDYTRSLNISSLQYLIPLPKFLDPVSNVN
jgi:hypothetical protein